MCVLRLYLEWDLLSFSLSCNARQQRKSPVALAYSKEPTRIRELVERLLKGRLLSGRLCIQISLFRDLERNLKCLNWFKRPQKDVRRVWKTLFSRMWAKDTPRLECVHQLSIQPCTLTPLASLCLPVRGSGGWQVNPWPSPQPYPSFPPLSRALFHSHAATHHPPLLSFSSCPISLKATVFLLTLLLSQVQGLAGRLHWSGNLCLVS